jgi:hypothetical protein
MRSTVRGQSGSELQRIRRLDSAGGAKLRRRTEEGPVQLYQANPAASREERLVPIGRGGISDAVWHDQGFQ